MNRSEFQDLLEIARRRPLTESEESRVESYLAAHPDARREWDDEQGLNQLLGQLDGVPMSSNFTARVLQAAQRESSPTRAVDRVSWFDSLFIFFRAHRLATATIIVVLGLMAVQQYRQRERARVVESLANLPNVEMLQDFDAIARLSQVRGTADEDLLAALQ